MSEFSRKCNVEISLFKRMLQNGMDCPTLKMQHRMRPEIFKLLSFFQPNLKNHKSVFKFESIKGVKKNVFFIDHKEYEQEVSILFELNNFYPLVSVKNSY